MHCRKARIVLSLGLITTDLRSLGIGNKMLLRPLTNVVKEMNAPRIARVIELASGVGVGGYVNLGECIGHAI